MFVYGRVRGQGGGEAVVPKSLIKSVNSCKSFSPTSDFAVLERWIVR